MAKPKLTTRLYRAYERLRWEQYCRPRRPNDAELDSIAGAVLEAAERIKELEDSPQKRRDRKWREETLKLLRASQ